MVVVVVVVGSGVGCGLWAWAVVCRLWAVGCRLLWAEVWEENGTEVVRGLL